MSGTERGRGRRRTRNGREVTPCPRASQSWVVAVLLGCTLITCAVPGQDGAAGTSAADSARVRPGVEVLLADSLGLIEGRRVGLITNQTGIDHEGTSTIDLLAGRPEVHLVALFSPEHGIRGAAAAGARVESGRDERTGLPIHSLYGATRKPTPAMLAGVDVLVFDIQDVGARYFTYVSTMALAMQAAGEAHIPFVVLDRPNPIGGEAVQGNVLDTAFASFIGMYPEPMRHGMTVGELARMIRAVWGVDVELHVIPMEGWHRDMLFDRTGLPWIAPSPNMPSPASALDYPGTCLFEGTPLSVGRGTARAFQWVGAPWLDGDELARRLEALHLEGVRFEPATFTPRRPGDGKFDGIEVHGVRFVPTAPSFDPTRAAVAALVEARRMSGEHWSWNVAHFDELAGTDALRLGIDRGEGVGRLTAGWSREIKRFRALRQPYLLYR